MITRVRLSNWRAYGDVEIELEPGTTFLIGMNGVGKSSFIEAVRWVFDRSEKADVEFIRKGERVAYVDVTIQLAGWTARLKRSLSLGNGTNPLRTPKVEAGAWIDGREVGEAELFDRLEAEWGADLGFVARTAFLNAEFTGPTSDNELRAHLCRAYDLNIIEDNVRAFDVAIKAAAAEADKEYRAGENLDRQTLELGQELDVQQALLRDSDVGAQDLERALQAAASALSEAQRIQGALEDQGRWDLGREKLAESSSQLIGQPPAGADLRVLLRSALAAASLQRDEARELNARLRGRLSTLEAALAALDAAQGDCPVCRRPLDDDSRAHAHRVQEADLTQVVHDLDNLDITARSEIVDRIQSLLNAAERLGDRPSVAASEVPDVASAERALGEVQNQRDSLLGERGATKARIESAQSRLAELKRQTEAAATAPAAYRRVAALSASRDALKNTITAVLNAQLGPIGAEISARWDALFPDRAGLIVDPDGNLSRPMAGSDLGYRSFSAGEKTVARLLLRLATLISTTRVPFCWIDEPLEHLDPKSRLVVARTLAQLGRQQVLGQILVTTYEQSIATMVGQGSDGPRVEYLGTAQVAP
jgi:DNA repair exonuclease SbcCD ATPase subunit